MAGFDKIIFKNSLFLALIIIVLLISACSGINERINNEVASDKQVVDEVVNSINNIGNKIEDGFHSDEIPRIVNLKTSDNKLIVGSYYDSNSSKGLILLHMLGSDRHSYDDLALYLKDYFKVLSIDFRGHGDSEGDFRSFSGKDFVAMLRDVEAAADFLRDKGVSSLSVVGASIGANTALVFASEHDVDKLVLLSPGSDYRSIDVSSIYYDKPLLVLVSKGDSYSFFSVQHLAAEWPSAVIKVFSGSFHGTNIINNLDDAKKAVIDFLLE